MRLTAILGLRLVSPPGASPCASLKRIVRKSAGAKLVGTQRETEGNEMAGKKPGPNKGDPRQIEAGRRGGLIVKDERGSSFFAQIGRKGGASTLLKHGEAHFAELGRKERKAHKQERIRDHEARA